eukprot:6192601-Pleurochrysis_carterae.AAC.1
METSGGAATPAAQPRRDRLSMGLASKVTALAIGLAEGRREGRERGRAAGRERRRGRLATLPGHASERHDRRCDGGSGRGG